MTNHATARCPLHGATGTLPECADVVAIRDAAGAQATPLHEARAFFELLREETGMAHDAWARRLAGVEAEIAERGTYTHTRLELTVGARLAWRHHTRCIGKLYWRSLTVFDRRDATSTAAIRDACFEHLRWSANGGQARPLITVFAPDAPGARAPRVRNKQLVGFAGHRAEDGSVLGDPATADLTELVRACGWAPADPPGRFDLLPLLIEAGDESLTVHDVPEALTYGVPIEHPTEPGIAALGLRWYGFPTISDMTLSIGGIAYPLAPFTGWYVAPEISARDLTDPHRYNLLAAIGEALGLDPADRLWRDRALVEITAAVLHSYERAGLRIDDHHGAAERFHRYTLSERRKGREVDAEWAWLVAPISGSATPVFHESYPTTQRWPNFLRRAA